MRFSVSVVDGSGPAQEPRVVLLDAEPDHLLGDVLPPMLAVTGSGAMHASFAARVPVWVDGRPVDRTMTLREAGLEAGAVVALHQPDPHAHGLPTGPAELRVVGGPGAGRVHRAGLGATVVGCGATGLSLPDLLLPADALTVHVDTSAAVTVTAAAGVEAYLEGKELTAGEPADWSPGAYLRCGHTVLQLALPQHAADADVTPSTDRLGRDFNRPPRLLPPPWTRSFTLPREPSKPRRMSVPWAMVLAPIAMAVPSALIFGSWRYALLGLLSPILAIFNWVSGKRGAARDYKEAKEKYDKDTETVTGRLESALVTERTTRREQLPDPAEVLLTAMGPGRRLWERRRADPDYLVWRLGLADLPSTISLSDPNLDEVVDEAQVRTVDAVPVSLAVRQNGIIGLTGQPERFDAVARWLIGQSVVLHSPRDLRIVVITDGSAEDRLGWTRWLPHCRVDGEVVAATVGSDQESTARRVGELSQLVTERQAQLSKVTVSSQAKATPAPDYLVILDGARRFRALPGVVTLLRDGPSVGVEVLCLDEDPRSLPEECRAIITCTDDTVTLHQTGADDVTDVLLDLVEPRWADRVAVALAPLRDTTPSVEDSGLPRAARLLDCVGMPDPTAESVLTRWTPRGTTDVVIGKGFDGDFRLDLRKDGPHALVAGTTGSGKSELLQTLVASLALANRPDQLTFVLVDYKGGSAFKECNKLPHTVGMVTDLDTHLVERALTSLGAELRRREHLLEGPGAKDLEDYWALQRTDPSLPAIPRLALVIDEFASLKAELPDFVTGLVTIAQRGRSLGIHLVLATQRPSGVISADIRANTNLRIALRVTDEGESRDVIDAPDAGHLGADTPGRGYARLGPGGVLPFQAGRVGGRRPSSDEKSAAREQPLAWEIPWATVGHPAPIRPRPEGSDTDEGDTDLSVLVEAITGADRLAAIPEQFRPWLAPLPDLVTAADLAERLQAEDPEAAADAYTVAWALEDRPAQQRQVPTTFTLGRSGHLFVVGGARSGRSTMLRTLAGSLAARVPARDLHLYGLDCGNGALLPLTALPHTGAVVQRTETERASRLLQRLRAEVSRRQEVLAASGYADIDEQRAGATDPDDKLPYAVLLVDRWEGFMSDLADVDLGSLLEAVLGLLREGASVGVHVVVTGDRTLLASRTVSLVESKFLMRMPDKQDFAMAGLKVKDLPETIGDGRGVWAEGAVEAQVALLGSDPSGAAQSEALREIGRQVAPRDADVPPALRPIRLGALSSSVRFADVVADLAPASRAPSWVPFGVGGDDVELLGVDLGRSPAALVVGAPMTGRTGALRFVAAYLQQAQRAVLAVSTRPSALTELVGEADSVVGTDADPEAFVARLRDLPAHGVVLIDDAEAYREGPLAPVLLALVRQAADKEIGLIAAGVPEAMSAGFSGWIYEARRGRQGLALSPSEPLAGEAFGGRVGRSSLQPRPHPGRGVLFDGTGAQVLVQVPDLG